MPPRCAEGQRASGDRTGSQDGAFRPSSSPRAAQDARWETCKQFDMRGPPPGARAEPYAPGGGLRFLACGSVRPAGFDGIVIVFLVQGG